MTNTSKSYLALAKVSGHLTGFSIVKTIEEGLAFGSPEPAEANRNEAIATEASNPTTPATTQTQEIISLFLKYVNLVFSFYPLIHIGTTLKSPLTEGFIKTQIQTIADAHCPVVADRDHVKVFELDTASLALLEKSLSRFWSLERGLSVLPHATLLSIVASFDSMFSEIVHAFLGLYKDRYKNENSTISIAKLIEIGSIDNAISEIIDTEIFELMRGSHHEQSEFIKQKLNVDIASSWKRYPDFIEIFERRNLIAHGETHFTPRYHAKSTEHGNPKSLGGLRDNISISSSYLRQSSDILLEYGVLLIFSLWRKHVKTEENAPFDWTNIVAMKTIVEGRYTAASRILSYLIQIKSNHFTDQSRKMAIVNLANALYKSNKSVEADAFLNKEDWTAVSPDFKICIAAIKGEIDKVVDLMEVAVKTGSISSNDFREWPAFDKMRNIDKFSQEYERIFSEPLVPAKLTSHTPIDSTLPADDTTQDG